MKTTFLRPGLDVHIIKAIHEFIAALKAGNTIADKGLATTKAIELLFLLYGSGSENILQAQPTGDRTRNLMNHACLLMQGDLGEKLKAQEIARRIGMWYENFRKKFFQFSGESPVSYRIGLKIKRRNPSFSPRN